MKDTNNNFYIACVGASAGGLTPLEQFVANMPSDSGVAFIIIQHLDPQHKSVMDSLLTKYTDMEVKKAEDGLVVEPNCIYLRPPNKNIDILNRTLLLEEPEDDSAINLPIDHFLRSLAQDQSEKSISIILSGTGTDGTLGSKAIIDAGGMTMVQEEQQAEYTGMPRSAINTGLIDFILPVEKMPEELIEYIQHPYIDTPRQTGDREKNFQHYLNEIYIIVRAQTGHDFSNYKQSTIRRRVERRMAIHHIENIGDYVRYIKKTDEEVNELFKDLVITVTRFFRDIEAFNNLKKKVLIPAIKATNNDSSFRCWVPGCSTGEEAYSLGMLILEAQEELEKQITVKIFATDIDEESIRIARKGKYPDSIRADIPSDKLERFFTGSDNNYRINKQIREMIVFAQQNVLEDPPFSNLDLVSCRNLLIYLNQTAQEQLIQLFHYVLNQDGFLFLGSSESIGDYENLFNSIDTKWKIFKNLNYSIQQKYNYSNLPFHNKTLTANGDKEEENIQQLNIAEITEKVLLENYSPPCVIVNGNFDILYFSGNTDKYLSTPKGEPNFNILNMAKGSIRYKISSIIHKATEQETTIRSEDIQINRDENILTFDLEARPLTEFQDRQNLILLVFIDKSVREKTLQDEQEITKSDSASKRIKELKKELKAKEEDLQNTIAELQISNEKLRTSNEELQSTNEELQSTNEELETSKEELRSTNEELTTVNAELNNKVEELSKVNDDMKNLLASTEIGTIFLDLDLCIKRFTPAVSEIFNVIDSDIGRPISDITPKITYNKLTEDAQEVLDTLNSKQKEVKNTDGTWFSMRIRPYRTTENVIDGVVITFVDITEIKKAEEVNRLATVVQDSNDAITLLNLNGEITAWNKGAKEMYGYTEEEALEMNIMDMVPKNKKSDFRKIIEKLRSGKDVDSFITERKTKSGDIIKVWLTITKLVDDSGNITAISTTERDISSLDESNF